MAYAFLCFSLGVKGRLGHYIEAPSPWPSVILSELPHEYIKPDSLPLNFDWRDARNGTGPFISAPTNQFLPNPCGSCWSHASTGALTDRFTIAKKLPVPRLSMQVLLDCGAENEGTMGTCEGGSDIMAYQFIYKYGITDVTCSPYMGVSFTHWGEGTPCAERMCKKCDIYGTCELVNGTKYYISEYGPVTGESDMMAEIYARGPIACSVWAHTDKFLKYTGGVISDPTNYNGTTHVVVLTGWGVDKTTGLKYWVGRNSFGTVWGEGGWFKLERGKNALDIERHPCAWAVPKL